MCVHAGLLRACRLGVAPTEPSGVAFVSSLRHPWLTHPSAAGPLSARQNLG